MEMTITVNLRDEHTAVGVSIEIPPLLRYAFNPIDVCDDPLMASIVPGGVYVKDAERVLKLRGDAAELLSKNLTTLILGHMQKNDLKNGDQPRRREYACRFKRC